MTLPTRAIEPTRITAGEKVEWWKQFDDYSAVQWNLTYSFRGPGTGFDVTATADGTNFVVTIPVTTTSTITTAGKYQWQAWMVRIGDSTNRHMVGSGFTQFVKGTLGASTSTTEIRSIAKQIIDSIDAAVLAFASSDVQEYEISTPAGTRRVKRSDKQWFMEMRKTYAAIYAQEQARERARNGKSVMQQMGVRFTDV